MRPWAISGAMIASLAAFATGFASTPRFGATRVGPPPTQADCDALGGTVTTENMDPGKWACRFLCGPAELEPCAGSSTCFVPQPECEATCRTFFDSGWCAGTKFCFAEETPGGDLAYTATCGPGAGGFQPAMPTEQGTQFPVGE